MKTAPKRSSMLSELHGRATRNTLFPMTSFIRSPIRPAILGKPEAKKLAGKTATDSKARNGWGASAVDALSTAIVMGQKDIVGQILDHIATIDYSQTSTDVSLFETTIRYLAGMLSGYDFLSGPLSDLADNVWKPIGWEGR